MILLALSVTSYTPPKLVSRASSVVEPAGAGRVLVQVQVNADGTFKVLRVIKSSNPADNAAALNIAEHSTYAPALKNGKPVAALFDMNVVFGAQAVSGAGGQIAQMLHDNDWVGARSAAEVALTENPKNQLIQAQLGVADAYLHDVESAATAFDRAGTIPDMYQNVAMQVYSLHAVDIAQKQPDLALAEAQKAVSMNGDYGAYYALGTVEHDKGDNVNALQALSKAYQLAQSANPPADATTMRNMLQATLATAQALHDTATAAKVTSELNAASPGMSGKLTAYTLDQQGTEEYKRHDYGDAIAAFEKAAAADPQWAGATEYTKAALVMASEPIPNYRGARAEVLKAIDVDPNFAPAYYLGAVAMGSDALTEGNASELQDATDYANKAAALAEKQGDMKLATSARYYARYHQIDANLRFWSTQLMSNPLMKPNAPAPNN
ncbi:MAG TPA: energy transducer TonB [Candidatus Baltobacteraceae bacterium]|nr:energy transducer TonB [Candidatus Baltobacteraceae bacterium]